MAAFTEFSDDALKRYLVMFSLGELESVEPIAAGIENSNYFVTLSRDGAACDYVLTILEGLSFDDAPFFNQVLARLHQDGLPVAAPQSTLDGMASTIFCGKPAFLVRRLPGSHPTHITTHHLEQIGAFLGTAHTALGELTGRRDNPYDPDWMRKTISVVADQLAAHELSLLEELAAQYDSLQGSSLPRGLIHGDLFRDNALFDDEGHLTGVIDFYHACDDLLIQDLAVVINDWCIRDDGTRNPELETALLSSYDNVRPLLGDEREAMTLMLRTTAARFALTRLLSGDPPLKDPRAMLRLAQP